MSDTGRGRARPAAVLDRRDGLAALVTVLCFAALRRGFAASTDVFPGDEAVYHEVGWRLLHRGLLDPSPESSPLYAAWCGLWQLVCGGDLAVAYLAQWVVTDLLLTLAVLVVLRCAGLPRAAAVVGAVFWASRAVVVSGWPRVSYFAMLLALAGVIGASLGRRLALPLALLAAVFVRPEFALPLAALAAARTAGRFAPRLRVAAGAAAVLVIVGAGLATSPRLFYAFSQHYALRNAPQQPGLVDVWHEHERITGAAFPGARTVVEAARIAPAEMARHVAGVVSALPATVADAFWDGGWAPSGRPARVLLLLLVLVLGLAPIGAWPRPDPAVLRRLALLLTVVLPSLFVRGKAVYALPLLLLAVVAAASFASRAVAAWSGWPAARRAVLPAGAALAALLCWRAAEAPRERPYLAMIVRLRAAHAAQAERPWRLLESDIVSWCSWLDRARCTSVPLSDLPDAPLRATLAAARPDVIVVSRTWLLRPALAADPDRLRFVQEPEAFGFRRVFAIVGHAAFSRVDR